ncbi:MAG: sigma-70 family RNA polymerase sigma factor [Terracidiphilus sp.]|nr:sigma-70 family RNA polymerase sigma factor [Terracidiphilus sp.]MDR3796588.1 sigma-70 family RNA polymerase sigma factor [Terracidiphilus sp.]
MTEQDRQISEMVAEQGSRLRNFIRKRVPNEADAEDLLQEVFSEVVEAFRLHDPIAEWSAWMFQVARNRIVDFFRRKQRWTYAGNPSPEPDEAEISLLDSLPSPDAGPAEAYAQTVLLDALEEALDELPVEQREVFIAHEVDGESFKQIAARTGVSVNTLLSRKHYAVARLRSRLSGLYNEFLITGEESK